MSKPGVPKLAGLVCAAAGTALVACGAVLAGDRTHPAPSRPVPVVNVGQVPPIRYVEAQPAGDDASHPTAAGHAAGTMPAGARLRIPALDVDAPITRVHLAGNVMQVPQDPRQVGWWAGSSAPGSTQGNVVIVGHINYAGVSGALGALPQARPGNLVVAGKVRYRIAAVRTYRKTSGIPATAFAHAGAPRLVLITCGGPFDAASGNYEDNIVAYAVPA